VPADDRAVLSSIYAALADAVEKDGTVIVSTATLADGTGRALDLAFHGRKLAGDGAVGEAIDKHIATALGWDAGAIPDVIVTPVLRGKVAAAYREISAAAR
jgi:hypothetical protein